MRRTLVTWSVAVLTAGALAAASGSTTLALAAPGDTTVAAGGSTFTVTRVSVGDRGTEATNGERFPERPSISASGRYVTFVSLSPDLVAGDTNGSPDVFVRDRLAGTTVRASVSSTGAQSRSASTDARISADGRVVVFTTDAALVASDTNRTVDVYARDLQAGTTSIVSARADGRPGGRESFFGHPSATGRFVAFQTFVGYAPGDDNRAEDVYVRDLRTGSIERVSLLPREVGPVAAAFEPRLSDDGRTVLFATLGRGDRLDLWVRDRVARTTTKVETGVDAAHVVTTWSLSGSGRFVAFATDQGLADTDRNEASDAYRLDLVTGRTVLVSQGTGGQQSPSGSDVVVLSRDGSVAVFTSAGGGLVPDDTNGLDDVFRRDIGSGTTTRVSVSSAGGQGDAESGYTADVAVSSDGRHVAFASFATNLVPDDRNDDPDVFVWSRAGDR